MLKILKTLPRAFLNKKSYESEENLYEWFEAGVISVGIGSQLFKKEILDARDYTTITARTIEIVDRIRAIKLQMTKDK